MIVYTEESYREQWRKLVSESEPAPAVDFTKEIAVLLLAGQKRTGGYAIEPKGVSVDDEGTLVVDAPLRTPGENSYVLQSFTSPWAVIAVEPRRENLSGVRWNP